MELKNHKLKIFKLNFLIKVGTKQSSIARMLLNLVSDLFKHYFFFFKQITISTILHP